MKRKKRSWKQFQKDEFRKDILPYVRWLMRSIRKNPQKYSTPEKINELYMIIEFCKERNIDLFEKK